MEDSKLTNRLTLAVYLFLAALAVILALVGIKYIQSDSPTRDLIINLSTEILGVVIIFFIVNQLFLLNKERDFVKQIESLKDGIKSKFSPFFWESRKYGLFDFEKHPHNAETVYLLGYNMVALVKESRIKIARAIEKGTRIKILIVDINSEAGKLLENVSISKRWVKADGAPSLKHISVIKDLLKEKNTKEDLLEVKVMSWIPSCSMIIFINDRDEGVAKITLHRPSINVPIVEKYTEHLDMIFDQKEYRREYEYFKENFEILWNEKFTRKLEKIEFDQ